MGLVSSINRPGGNATGVSIQVSALEPKRCELLRNILPSASMVGAMVNPDNPNAENHGKDLEEAASAFGLKLLFLERPETSPTSTRRSRRSFGSTQGRCSLLPIPYSTVSAIGLSTWPRAI
jgi:putative ABC transport system substrate-binding protein